MKTIKRRKSYAGKIWLGLLTLVLAGAGIGYWRWLQRDRTPQVPTTAVTLGEFVDYVDLRGEISVQASNLITAPYNAGDLSILKLARDGAPIKKGDTVVQFDPTSLQRNADQFRMVLKQIEAEIQRANAQQRLREEQIRTDEMSAQFALERARLDASTQDVVPALEHEKNLLALAKAEQKVREVATRIETSRIGAAADLAGTIRRREKARADLEQAEKNLAALNLVSTADGMLAIMPNSRARTSVLGGGSTPPFKEGDRLWAGAAIAEVPDLTTIQAVAPVYEADRGKVAVEQPVIVLVDALPDKQQTGRVATISPLAKLDYTTYPVRKNFDLTVRLDQPDARLRPGMSANFRVEVERLPNSLIIPAEAVFDKGGRIVAYVISRRGYEERTLEVARRGNGHILAASGLKAGELVALKDPTLESQK